MNKFPVLSVIAACDAYLLNANTINERQRVQATIRLRAYANALLYNASIDAVMTGRGTDLNPSMLLSLDEFEPISDTYGK